LYSLFQEKSYFLQLIKTILLTKWYFIFEPSLHHSKIIQNKILFLEENLAKSPTFKPLTDESSLGGFELVFARTQRTGKDIVGVNPNLFYLFPFLTSGSQIMLEGYNLNMSIIPVEKLSAPLIINKNKELIRYSSGIKKDQIDKILSLGDILIDPSLLSNFNPELKIINTFRAWISQLKRKYVQNPFKSDFINQIFVSEENALFLKNDPDLNSFGFITFLIENNLPIPYFLLPKWRKISISQLKILISSLFDCKESENKKIIIKFNDNLTTVLYEGHIPFIIKENEIIILENVNFLLILKKFSKQLIEAINKIKNKNELIDVYKYFKDNLSISFSYKNPNLGAIFTKTWKCVLKEDSPQKYGIMNKKTIDKHLKNNSALKNENFYVNDDNKGETFQKSLIRKKYKISLFNGPNFNFQLPNSTLSQFKPREIGTSVSILKKLGYRIDVHGNALRNGNQTVNVLLNDIILPKSLFNKLKSIYDFIDEELEKIYDQKPFFNLKTLENLIGKFYIGCNPNGSTGVIGRLIGWHNNDYNDNCLIAHPFWHASKYSDCTNEEPDNLFLLEDLILNFNLNLLPSAFNNLSGKPVFIKEIIALDDISIDFNRYFQNSSRDLTDPYMKIKSDAKNLNIVNFSSALSSYNMNPNFYDSLETISDQIEVTKVKEFSGINFHKQMPFELTRYDFNLIEKNIELYAFFYYGSKDFIRKLYFEYYIFPRFMAQLDLWLEQSIECPNCKYPYPYAIFRDCTNCGFNLKLTYDKNPIILQYDLIKKLLTKFPSEPLYESFYFIKNQFKLLFPSDEKLKP
jgi:hypothetical protein